MVALLAAAGWLVYRTLQARTELDAARSELTTARTALLDQRTADATPAIAAAGRHTSRARQLTGGPVFWLAAHVPVAGRTITTIRGLTVAADDIARGVLPAAASASERVDPRTLRRPDGSFDVPGLQAVTPIIDRLAASTAAITSDVRRLPTAGVVGPVRKGRDQFAAQLTQLSSAIGSAQRALRLAPALLGADRPRGYFVLVQQPGESRGTGGLPGGFAVIEADKGRLRVTSQGSNAELRNGDIPVPAGVGDDYVYEYGKRQAFRLWQNVNLSPDLPVVAKVVEARWRAQGGLPLAGVIALDPIALSDLLRGAPPLPVGGGRLVAPADLPAYLGIEQYRDFSVDQTQRRKDNLVTVARAAATRVTTGGDSRVVLRGLADAVRTGHLRMASDDPALAPGLHAAGIDGALPAGPGPVAYAVVNNGTQGKLDYFLDRTIAYTAGRCRGGRRDSQITVRLRNDAPASGLPAYLTIRLDETGLHQSTESAVLLSVYAERGADLRSATLDGRPTEVLAPPGEPTLDAGLEAGLPFWRAYVSIPRGQTRTLVLHLSEPATSGPVRVPEQPLARPLRRVVTEPTCP